MKRWFKNSILAGLGILSALVLFAVIVQFTDTNDYDVTRIDPTSGLPLYIPYETVHELTGCFENSAQINNLGFHGPDIEIPKAPQAFRIVVVGSSYVEARQVPVADMFTTLLQNKLNADPNKRYTFEVIPLGFNGNSTLLNTLYYKYYGSSLKPDLVIDLETAFELIFRQDAQLDANGHVILAAPVQAPAGPLQVLARHSKLLINLYHQWLVFKTASGDFVHRPLFFLPEPSAALINEAYVDNEEWNTKSALVGAMMGLTEEDHAKLLYATFVGREEPTGLGAELATHFSQLAQTDGFLYDDLTPDIEAQEDATGVSATYLPCDAHWSPTGHAYVAQALYEYLQAHPNVLTKQ